MIPQALTGDPCNIAQRWGISTRLAYPLVKAARTAERAGLGTPVIISGWRSCAQQTELLEAGKTAATCATSTHVSCPATGADVWLAGAADDDPNAQGIRAVWVTICEAEGLRVGGGSSVLANGLPRDWNHVDLGPRGS